MTRLFERPIAHRGLHDRNRGVIENSRSAFAAAVERGYAIECDVQLSSDGVPFIFHDDDFDRLTDATGRSDARPIVEVTKLTLKGSATGDVPPLFAEFLAQVGGRTQLQIELKQQKDAAGALALLNRAHALQPGDGEISYHLAVALDANSKRDEARKLLKSLLDSGVKFADRPAAVQLASSWQ